MHNVILLKTGRLIIPRFNALRRVLDCGTGNGCWAIEVAQNYPNCEVRKSGLPFPALFSYTGRCIRTVEDLFAWHPLSTYGRLGLVLVSRGSSLTWNG